MLPSEKVSREFILKKDVYSDENLGKRPEERTTEELLKCCIININKPQGPSSHLVTEYVSQILGETKAGHSGTLDPNVTGCLPVAVGRATRIVQLLQTTGKEYICLMHLHADIPEAELRKVIGEKFIGKISQLPPVRSAVKRELREREIYYLEILEIQGRDVLLKIGCEAGTYIRKLVHDIGLELKAAAHMLQLKRTKVGPFNDSNMVTLQDLRDAFFYYNKGNDKRLRGMLFPIEKAVEHIPKVVILDSAVESVCHGANVNTPGIAQFHSDIKKNDLVAVMTLKGELVAYGNALMDASMMMSSKGTAVNVHKVFMLPGTYLIRKNKAS